MRDISERAFQAYGETLENMTAFRYMVRVMEMGDDDWPAVLVNLHKTRNSWGRLSWIFIRDGAGLKVSEHFSRR